MHTPLQKVGDDAVMTLTPETLAILQAKSGDALSVVQGDNGFLQVTTRDPDVVIALAAAEIVMSENREMLAALV